LGGAAGAAGKGGRKELMGLRLFVGGVAGLRRVWSRISDLLIGAVTSPVAAMVIGALLFLLAAVEAHFAGGVLATVAESGLITVVSAWLLGVVAFLWRPRLPMLCFYAVLLGFVCFVDTYNFGLPEIIRSWLTLIALILSVELVGVSLMRRLPRLFLTAVSTSYHIALASLILLVFCYNLRFNAPISGETIVALLQTDTFEAREYIWTYVDLRLVMVVASCLLIIIAFNVVQHRLVEPHIPPRAIATIAIVALGQFASLYKPSMLETTVVGTVDTYYTELAVLRKMQATRQNSLPSIGAHKIAKGETYVLVIGESENRDHMSLYGYRRQTTPWIGDQTSHPNWIHFNHAYSNHTQTVQTLSLALTEANQYNGKNYSRSLSILDVMKAAGFQTYWLSNQRLLGKYDTPISAIANTTDFYVNTNHYTGKTTESDHFDSELVERFRRMKDKINNADNNFIVLHLMGSHAGYCNRYPPSFAQFGSAYTDCYDNSVAFTDFVLQQIFAEAQQLPGFRAFVYLSDHGEDVEAGVGHDARSFTFKMTHIPLLIWLSDDFRAMQPEVVEILNDHGNAVWTNDLLYDLMVGLTGVSVQTYDPKYDLSSSSYQLNWATALTLHGKKQVIEDPDLAPVTLGYDTGLPL
jgi:heptose-I-phosphate ethanolaminephosphotransferase